MYRWLNTNHVSQWYPIDDVPKPGPELVRRHYLPMIRGEERTYPYLIDLDGAPIGYIQAYVIADHSDYARAVQVEGGTAGVDLFIGETSVVHRGLGPAVLSAFLRQIVFGTMAAASCIIGPQPENSIAIRA
jgi:aminoglycoside 6'-N-acetyltransferase